jgi:chromate transport protein ChrA
MCKPQCRHRSALIGQLRNFGWQGYPPRLAQRPTFDVAFGNQSTSRCPSLAKEFGNHHVDLKSIMLKALDIVHPIKSKVYRLPERQQKPITIADSVSIRPASPKEPIQDVESLRPSNSPSNDIGETEKPPTDNVETIPSEDDDLTQSNAPKFSLPYLFWFFFYNFGLFAWGGPVAQIALIKEKLVLQDKWITLARFQRVFAVYQILPGPEAAELCMFFGCLSAGRIGGIVAGLAFILPGFVLMLLASYLYSVAGMENKYFNASFRALQPIVAAMVSQAILTCVEACTDKQILDVTGHA